MKKKMSDEGKEGRFAKARNFKADSVLKLHILVHNLKEMYKKMHAMSDEELEEMWPSVAETGLGSAGKSKGNVKAKKNDKEFLFSLLSQTSQTLKAIEFAKQNDVDLQSKQTQATIKQQADEISRGH